MSDLDDDDQQNPMIELVDHPVVAYPELEVAAPFTAQSDVLKPGGILSQPFQLFQDAAGCCPVDSLQVVSGARGEFERVPLTHPAPVPS